MMFLKDSEGNLFLLCFVLGEVRNIMIICKQCSKPCTLVNSPKKVYKISEFKKIASVLYIGVIILWSEIILSIIAQLSYKFYNLAYVHTLVMCDMPLQKNNLCSDFVTCRIRVGEGGKWEGIREKLRKSRINCNITLFNFDAMIE